MHGFNSTCLLGASLVNIMALYVGSLLCHYYIILYSFAESDASYLMLLLSYIHVCTDSPLINFLFQRAYCFYWHAAYAEYSFSSVIECLGGVLFWKSYTKWNAFTHKKSSYQIPIYQVFLIWRYSNFQYWLRDKRLTKWEFTREDIRSQQLFVTLCFDMFYLLRSIVVAWNCIHH